MRAAFPAVVAATVVAGAVVRGIVTLGAVVLGAVVRGTVDRGVVERDDVVVVVVGTVVEAVGDTPNGTVVTGRRSV